MLLRLLEAATQDKAQHSLCGWMSLSDEHRTLFFDLIKIGC
jgi:hypothetical protein